MKRSIAAILLSLLPAAAFAQSAPANLPAMSVYGRAGIPGDTGPGQALPWNTLLANIAGAQSPNLVYASPASGPAALPGFRALVGADLPYPSANSLGGVQGQACSTHNWFNSLSNGIYNGITISIASPAVITLSNNFAAGRAVVFTSTGSLPTGLAPGVTYYVIAAGLSTSSFEVSATLGGAAVNTSGTQSGTHTLTTNGGVFGCTQPDLSDITGTITPAQCVAATSSALGCVKPDNATITVGAGGVLTANSGIAASVDAAGATAVTNCGTSNAFLENTSSSKIGCTAGPWTLLATLTASNSATLSDTTHFTSAYTEYEIRFTNVLPASTGTNLELQVHSGGSFQATSYLTNTFGTSGSATVTAQNATTFLPLNHGNGLINSGAGFSGFVRVANVSATTIPKIFSGVGGFPTSSVWASVTIGGIWNSNAAVDGIQLLTSSGNITSGTVEIYGRL